MSHDINTDSNGKASMAYVGEKPWHGLGQELTPDASFDVWTKEAGLDFQVDRASVQFSTATGLQSHPTREVLFRNDNNTPLGIVSKGYKVVQPEEVIHFFKDLSDMGGFAMETAGVLQQGQKVWAMAKVAEGVKIIGQDEVIPYVLMTTSFDGSTATSARLTAVRVVCANTMGIALRDNANVVRVPHNAQWDASAAKIELGLIEEGWLEYTETAKRMAQAPMRLKEADAILCEILGKAEEDSDKTRDSSAYKDILSHFYDDQTIGHELTEGRSVWTFTNAVTEYIDHRAGRLQDNRIRSAWYGAGSNIKAKAWAMASELVA